MPEQKDGCNQYEQDRDNPMEGVAAQSDGPTGT
jgi:hypothetical protein